MRDDPEEIRRNIAHFQHLLTLQSKEYSLEQVRKLLAEAQARLPYALAMAARSKRQQLSG
jgi:hypothetical protein